MGTPAPLHTLCLLPAHAFCTAVYPDLSYYSLEVPAAHVNRLLGLGLGAQEMAVLLGRMQLVASVKPDGETLALQVPPTRSDILHACDIVEDVAIAYGFNNIPKRVRLPAWHCVARRAEHRITSAAGMRPPRCWHGHR